MTSSNGAAKVSPNSTVDVETELLSCPPCHAHVRLALASVEQTDNPKTPKIVPIAPLPQTGFNNQEESQPITPITVTQSTVEKRAILAAMRETGNDKGLASRMLGIGRTTLYRKLREYGFKPEFAPAAPRSKT